MKTATIPGPQTSGRPWTRLRLKRLRRLISLWVAVFVTGPLPVDAEELWLAVGYGGRRMISTDGKTWTITAEWAQPGGDDSNNLMSAVFAQNKFVVVGGGGGGPSAAGHILTSTDGKVWKQVYSAKARINPIVFGGDRFVVGTSAYPSGKLMWSTDAETWNEGAAIATKGLTHHRGGAYGNGKFVLVGNAGGMGGRSWAIVTADGQTITHETDQLAGHGTIVFGQGRFWMLTSHAQAELIASTDGARWEAVPLPNGAKVDWLVNAGTRVAAGTGQKAFETADGQTWDERTMKARGSVKWSDGRRWIGSSWPGKMAFSEGGMEWVNGNPLPDNGINRVVYRGPQERPYRP